MASTQRTSVTSRNVSQQRPVYLMPKQELIDVVGRNPRNHPKHLDVAEALCKEQRKKLHARYLGGPHSPAVGAMTKLRVADYERETITSDVNHAVRSRSISKWESQGTAEKGDDGSLSGTPYTSTDCIAEIVGNCRCVTPVQGGAVLWTGEIDGSIALRNGLTGEITKVLPPVELKRRKRSSGNGDSLSTAEVIFSVLGHAFVGYSDGMIRIYDTLVVTLVQESKTPHESSIAFFDQLSNGSVVAVSCNGQITLFDDYNQELADRENIFYPVRLTSWIELANSESVTAITACGSRSVIVGTSMGHIHSLDCQDLGLDVSFNVPKNNGQVTALCRANGLLFVGTECGNILVYKLNDLESDRQPLFLRSLEYHKQTSDDETIAKVSIVSFDNDANGRRLWSLDRTGRICNFDAVVETDFVLRVGPSNVSGGLPVRSMASVCHLDVLRLWALTSSGRNMLYTAEFDRTGYETDQVLVSMQEIINRDTQEINSWTANVTQIQSTNMKQRQRAVDVLQRLQQEGLHMRYFGRWIRHIYILRTERKRSRYAVSLVRNTQCDLLRIAYLRWLHLWQAHHEQKMKKAVEAYITYSARSERQRQFLSCLERHARERKDREGNLSHIADTLCFAHNDRIRRLCFSKLHTYSCMHQHTRKRKYLAIALEGNAKNILLRDYYYKMMHFMAARRVSRSKQEAAVAMCHATDNTLRRRCFGRLQRNAGTSALRRRKERLSHLLLQNSDYGLRSLFFHRWLEDASARTVERKEQEIRQRKMALAELEAQFITVEGGVHRSTLVQQHEADIAVLEQQKRDRADRLMQMEAYVQSLEHEVLQRERLLSSSTSRRQLFLDAMSRLKSRVLNFDADYELIGKTIERTTGAPVKTFQVIFHEIRKVLVAHLGEQPSFRKIGTSAPLDSMRYTWGGTDAEIRSSVMQRIPASVHAQMIESVKRLAIAFDLMQPMEDEEIDIEPEVAINARGLIAMYECLVDHRQRKSLQKQPSLIAA